MRYLVLAAIAVGVAATAGGPAEAARKLHRSYQIYGVPGAVYGNPDPSGGNAAAGGNNANSMSGSNSAGNNANGRTSGSGGKS
jgi:hypothetical protein